MVEIVGVGDVLMGQDLYFSTFRRQIVGDRERYHTPYGYKKMVYADWTASGRLYRPIEDTLSNKVGPYVGNTHSLSSETGAMMTRAYARARYIIKKHVHATSDDILITTGYGMTAAINKLQRLLGLRMPEKLKAYAHLPAVKRPVVFVSHMEHHSNHTSWLETICDVVCLRPGAKGEFDLNHLDDNLRKYRSRPLKIGSFTACSNVTGVIPPYHLMAKLMHSYGGYCFVDFAASAPYVNINMHPSDPQERLDAVMFSPHKFLGGPGACGVLVMNAALYTNTIPDHPGGGTVSWTNPWGEHSYLADTEVREDGGTPGFLQCIRAALAIRLKEKMGVENMLEREKTLTQALLKQLAKIKGLHILDGHITERLGIVSFYIEGIPYNLVVKILNDRYGIQTRGGCSCAGTYGHYLYNINKTLSLRLRQKVEAGQLQAKPGWVRISLHPTMTLSEISFIVGAIAEVVENFNTYKKDYIYLPQTNEYCHIFSIGADKKIHDWFAL